MRGFLWGVSTSSYQIEGAPDSGGKGESIWDAFCRQPGRIADASSGDVACDSYHRWKEDIALMRGLGVGACRFSVSWPRIQPSGRGPALEAGLDWYRRFAEGLLAAGIEPWVTLYHWDLPLALEEGGGWTARDTAFRFAEYAELVYRALDGLVSGWATLNEPWCSAFLGYGTGEHAPGRRDPKAAHEAAHHLLLGHGLATLSFRELLPKGRIGIVLNPATPRPATSRPEDREAALRASQERTGLWLDPVSGRGYPSDYLARRGMEMPVEEGDLDIIAAPLDYVGINYYSEDVVSAAPVSPACPDGFRYEASWQGKTEMGWPIVPEGLGRMLRSVNDGWSPEALYVMENGAAFADGLRDPADGHVKDPDRIAYLESHIASCLGAAAAGVPVRGYFAWTLVDNFEWSLGYSRKFGLASLDPATLDRRPKDSFLFYRDVVAGNVLPRVTTTPGASR